MNLYLLKRKDRVDYDQFDEAVVCAETEAEARLVHPGNYAGQLSANRCIWDGTNWICNVVERSSLEKISGLAPPSSRRGQTDSRWANPESLSVQLIGTAAPSVEVGVAVVSSFLAG